MVKCVAVADLHGHLPEIPACDILFIAGDIVPLEVQHRVDLSAEWLDTTFRRWLDAVPATRVVATWGNHDFIGQFPDLSNLCWRGTMPRFEDITLEREHARTAVDSQTGVDELAGK